MCRPDGEGAADIVNQRRVDDPAFSREGPARRAPTHSPVIASGKKVNDMEALRILERAAINWDYDEEADVLYLSVGVPKPAVGVDIGEGVIIRYDENQKEVVGITLIGLKARILRGLAAQQ